MSQGGSGPSWEKLIFWLVALGVGSELLASTLPRLLLPIVVLAGVFVVVRLVVYFTSWR